MAHHIASDVRGRLVQVITTVPDGADDPLSWEPSDAPHCATCGTTWNVSVVDGFPPTCWDCYELAVMRLAAAVNSHEL